MNNPINNEKNKIPIYLSMLSMLFLMLPVTFVKAEGGLIHIPAPAVLPLGALSTENPALFDVISELGNVLIDTENAGQVKVAPGDLLPISVRLANFGGGKRVDVLLIYTILTNTGEEIYESDQTIAVETTASFIKAIQIPFETNGGVYTAKTSITYMGQVAEATTQFPFTVERKILGFFRTDFFIYSGIIFIVGLLCFALGLFLVNRFSRRGILHDYLNEPRDDRIYYEILSDVITQMRLRVGDRAIEIALATDGLVVDKETGRVLDITESPGKVVAELISRYEKKLGKKVSFSLRLERLSEKL